MRMLEFMKKNQTRAAFITTVLLLLCAATSIVLRLAFLNEPLERDEGFYSAIALHILDGGIPYRDAAEQKGPLLFYLYALGLSVFGKSVAALRIFTALYNLLSLFGVYCFAREVAGLRAGLLAAFIYAVFSSLPMMQAAGSNAEVFLLMPMVWCAYFCLRWIKTGRHEFLVIAGIANSAALLIKLVAAPLSLLALVMVVQQGKLSAKLRSSLIFFLAPQALMWTGVLLFFAFSGALADFFRFAFVTPFHYVTEADGLVISGPRLVHVVEALAPELLPISVPGFALLLLWPWVRGDAAMLYCALLPWAALAATLLPGKNFPHYFINLLPFLSVSSAVVVVTALRQPPAVYRLLLLIPAGLLATLAITEHDFYWRMTPEEVSESKYGSNEFVLARDIGLYLRDATHPDDYVFQWGFDPQVYLISGRRFPGRLISSGDVGVRGNTPAIRRELMQDLERTRPAYIVIFSAWSKFPGLDILHVFMQTHGYRMIHADQSAVFYRRPD